VLPTANAAPVARLATLAASNASPTPPAMLLMAATTLAPVNSIPTGRARSPTVAIAAENRSSSAAGPKNWSGLRDQGAVVAADPLHLPSNTRFSRVLCTRP
jgi:hypothetical protein